jgi:hypothetical protein
MHEGTPQPMIVGLRVIASGPPDTIQYSASQTPFTLSSAKWQHFTVDLHIRGHLVREPFWIEAGAKFRPSLDLSGRELFLSIDSRSTIPVLLDDLKIEEIHPSATK